MILNISSISLLVFILGSLFSNDCMASQKVKACVRFSDGSVGCGQGAGANGDSAPNRWGSDVERDIDPSLYREDDHTVINPKEGIDPSLYRDGEQNYGYSAPEETNENTGADFGGSNPQDPISFGEE